MTTPREYASSALMALVTDDPLAFRVNAVLRCLRPLRSMRNFDTTIIEWVNEACDKNYTPKERAKLVADAIAAILCLWPPTDDLKPRGRL